MRRRIPLLAAAALVVLGLGARPVEAVTELPSVLVTAGALGDEDQDVSPGAVTVIVPEEVRGEFKTLPELLDQSVGVHVIRTQGRGGYTVASVRGSTSAQVAVYVDGVLANLESEAAVDLATIPVENVARIEVYRGHVPAAFGVSGMGAVINIVTVAPERAQGSLLVGLGEYGEYRSALRYATPLLGGDLLVATEFSGSDGDFSYLNDNGTPYNGNDDYEATRLNNGWDQRNLLLKWSRDAWTARFSWQDRTRDLPLQAPGNDKRSSQRDGTRLETEKWDVALGRTFRVGDVDMSLQAGHLEQEKEFFNPYNYLGQYGDLHNLYKSDRDFLSLSASLPVGLDHYLEFFGTYSRENLDVEGDVVDNLGGKSRFGRDKIDLSLQDSITLNRAGTLVAVPTLKWNDVDGEGHLSWSLAADWLFAPAWRLKTSFGRYHRAPNFYELYGDGATILPNEKLDWEEGSQWDLGLHWKGAWRSVETRVGLTYFHSEVDNLVEFIMINPRYGQYQNVSDAEIDGVELETRFIRHPWDLTLSYTYMRALNKTADSFQYDKRLPNRPESAVHARLAYAASERLRLFGEVDYTGDNYLDQRETVCYSDLTVVNAGLSWNLDDDKVLTVGVNDLFDKSKEMTFVPTSGAEGLAWYPLQGRTWLVSLLWKF
ncbi:TonB-dependent receptor plug domain-containing protein [Aminirod propionatiphilus]|uniref:TonB-dependent receptor n=1 Tax=Aminirod propionatiphilus TaxID=3415223 RepID=A0ACD1DVW1_9BACT|nr:TonB-dependent receptor [Synergistota bacterium]